jgi:UrcA family protein
MKNVFSLSSLAACAALATLAGVPAHADQAPASPEFAFKFSYDRSELQDAAKAEKLLVRLERAVRRHCDAERTKDLAARALVTDCIDTTMKDSMGKFGSSTLTQVYESRAAG